MVIVNFRICPESKLFNTRSFPPYLNLLAFSSLTLIPTHLTSFKEILEHFFFMQSFDPQMPSFSYSCQPHASPTLPAPLFFFSINMAEFQSQIYFTICLILFYTWLVALFRKSFHHAVCQPHRQMVSCSHGPFTQPANALP